MATNISAISPLDGRYADVVAPLRDYVSEQALIKARIEVELAWLNTVMQVLPEFEAKPEELQLVESWLQKLTTEDISSWVDQVKTIEATTNHDVKAVELMIADMLTQQGCQRLIPLVHIFCTSEDINNLAHNLLLTRVTQQLLLPSLKTTIATVAQNASANKSIVMMSRTHGQPATPTTWGKELAVFGTRLCKQYQRLENWRAYGKLNGATGTYAAHCFTVPSVDWSSVSENFVTSLGLAHQPITTQIEPGDAIAELMSITAQINNIYLDMSRDIWGYISIGLIKQKVVATETGSSTMPHKVNPIDFENAEGNIHIANALLQALGNQLPVSRWQRDLSGSTLIRNYGNALGHTWLSWQKFSKGFAKIQANHQMMADELDNQWNLLTEALQTELRLAGVADGYQRVKDATRGSELNADTYQSLVASCQELSEVQRQRLLNAHPSQYCGIASELTDQFVNIAQNL